MPWRAGWDGSAGLPRRYAPRNDNGGDGNGRGWDRVTVFGRIPLRCHCEPGRAWQSRRIRFTDSSLHGSRFGLFLEGRACESAAFTPWLCGSVRVGCRGDAGVAGWFRLDCRVATLLAMTTAGTGMGEVGRVPAFGRIPSVVIASPAGRGNPA